MLLYAINIVYFNFLAIENQDNGIILFVLLLGQSIRSLFENNNPILAIRSPGPQKNQRAPAFRFYYYKKPTYLYTLTFHDNNY
jgi:hypothetical protein